MVDKIKVTNTNQGDLVFIKHKRPLKTGWWRKTIIDNPDGVPRTSTVFILEKPMHKDFDPNNPSISQTRNEDGIFIMKETTLSYGNRNSNGELDYEILYLARGVASAMIVQNNYMPTLDMINSGRYDFQFTNNGAKLLEAYCQRRNEIERLACELI